MSIRVLLADDDLDFLDVTAYGLSRAGFHVKTVASGEEALDSWGESSPDIVVLDVHMPNVQGIDVCKEIRRASQVPVVLLSASRREADMIQGFQAGADDFVTKPISIQHLVLRLRAISRRISGSHVDVTPRYLTLDRLAIDLDAFSVRVDDRPIRLTRLEFRLLYCLAANVGRVVSSSRLIDFAWGLDGEGDASLLKTHFSHIRRKIESVAPDAPYSIKAFPGAGYSFQIS